LINRCGKYSRVDSRQPTSSLRAFAVLLVLVAVGNGIAAELALTG